MGVAASQTVQLIRGYTNTQKFVVFHVTAASTVGLGSNSVVTSTVFNHKDGFAPFSDRIQDILAGSLGSKHPDKREATDLL